MGTAPNFSGVSPDSDGGRSDVSWSGAGLLSGSSADTVREGPVVALGDDGCALTWGRLPVPLVGRSARAWGGDATCVSFGVGGCEPGESGETSDSSAYGAELALICKFRIIKKSIH